MLIILNVIFRGLLLIVRGLKFIIPAMSFIWTFLKKISLNPAVWSILAFAPLLMMLFEFLTGKPSLISNATNNFIAQMVDKMLQMTTDIDLQTIVNQIPDDVLEVCCYLGVTDALTMLFDGIVGAMTVMLLLRINLFIVGLKLRYFTKLTKM
jgi:hypothetical protein